MRPRPVIASTRPSPASGRKPLFAASGRLPPTSTSDVGGLSRAEPACIALESDWYANFQLAQAGLDSSKSLRSASVQKIGFGGSLTKLMSNAALCRALVAALNMLLGAGSVAAHPLDPLSGAEIASAVAVLRASDKIDGDTKLALIDLDEPPKADVLAWKPGQPFVRKAFIVARN